ncbi:MAG TPA: nitrate- and nitrite sensing domain-containing protein [Actinomycetes bacterium]
MILILPVLACAVLGALRVSSRISTSRQADRVTKLTEFSLRGTNLAHELERERGLAGRYLEAAPNDPNLQALRNQEGASDKALADYRKSVDELDVRSLTPAAKDKLSSALGDLNGLADLRHDIGEHGIGAPGALDIYSTTVADLLNANRDLIGRISNPDLAQAVGAFVSVSRITELAALERELVSGVLANGSFGAGQYSSLTSTLATRSVLQAEFQATATPEQRDVFVQTIVGPEVQRAKELQATVVASQGNGKLTVDPNQWWTVTSAEIDLMHQVAQRLGGSAVSRSRAIENSANLRAGVDSLAVLLVLALAAGLSLMVARSMLRPLRLLERSAKDVAQNRLPGVVAKLQRSSGEAPDLSHEIEPVTVPSRDEVGEVAAAFNAVNEVAVRVAAEQAALRMSIGDIFLNLARRSQALIDRQLELIDELEEEADSRTLASLFQLDHLATRMRRNAENLIVLSGAEPPRRWTQPIPLGEVIRGAIAEVEDYQRVALVPMEDVAVPGHAGADIIHLLSELIENATSFSPPGTVVRVGGQPAATGYIVEVEDRGLGMSDEELQEANERLANPPAIDFAVSRMLGLFVVSRLARRYGIRVQLRHSSYGGITAMVMLPASVVLPLGPQGPMAAPDPFAEAPALMAPQAEPEPVMAEPLPIFEQARSDWFEIPGGAPPPDPSAAYPPLAARFGEEVEAPPAAAPRASGSPWDLQQPFPTPAPQGPEGFADDPDPRLSSGPFRVWWDDQANGTAADAAYGEEQDELDGFEAAGEPYGYRPHGAPEPPEPPYGAGFWHEQQPDWHEQQPAEQPAPPPHAGGQAGGQWETEAGLPRRVPRANLAPGILTQREYAMREEVRREPRAARSPEEVRNLLSDYRSGIERGRRTAGDRPGGEPTGWDSVEGNEHDESG